MAEPQTYERQQGVKRDGSDHPFHAGYLNQPHMKRLQNKSGGSVVTGDVVVVDLVNAEAFDTCTTEGYVGRIGVIPHLLDGDDTQGTFTIASESWGEVQFSGCMDKITCDATAHVGEYLRHDGVAKQATPTGTYVGDYVTVGGVFAIALTESTTPKALLVGQLPSFVGNASQIANGIITRAKMATGLVTILDIDNTKVTVSNTTDETTIYSYTLAGGTLGTNGALELTVWGSYSNESGSGKTFTVNVKIGSTTILTVNSGNIPTANAGLFRVNAVIYANGSASAQLATFSVIAPSVGMVGHGVIGTGAENTATDKDIVVTVTHSAAAATITLVKYTGRTEILEHMT